jgi:hypothetical protein
MPNKVLPRMLDRLLAGLTNGPNLNCRPHNSRQRVDLTQLSKLADVSPEQMLKTLLGPEKCAKTVARVKPPRKNCGEDAVKSAGERAWLDQSNLLNKLRLIADDARTYENDTGVHALSIGFPILSLPPGSFAGGARNSTKRVLAPIAFIPVKLLLKRGATPSVELSCRGEGADRVSPNAALLSWIEQQTGNPQNADMFEDEEGADPWREIHELVKHVADAMQLEIPEALAHQSFPRGPLPGVPPTPEPLSTTATNKEPVAAPQGGLSDNEKHAETIALQPWWNLQPAPRGDDDAEQPAILLSAVLGLFPTAHQGLLRDTRAMIAEEHPHTGPIQNFLTSGIDFDAPGMPAISATTPVSGRAINTERLATAADPCQSRAVAQAREATGLVIHGPPGTGKSQTITNIIADHLARGQRVLLVCDKRTALDVVADRLVHMGLGSLCGIVHDPQRDQRDLYRSIHQQLDELPEAKLYPRAAAALEKIDAELQQLHDELTQFHNALMKPTAAGEPCLHELMGRWISSGNDSAARVDERAVAGVSAEQLQSQRAVLLELFQRAESADFSRNPWTKCAGVSLAEFLARSMTTTRTAMDRILSAAQSTDATADDRIPPFADHGSLVQQAVGRSEIVEPLAGVLPKVLEAKLTKLASSDVQTIRALRTTIQGREAEISTFYAVPIDPNLLAFVQPLPSSEDLQRDLLTLKQYIDSADTWIGLFAFAVKADAAKLLKQYALPRTKSDAIRLQQFLIALLARLALLPALGETALPSDEYIRRFLQTTKDFLPLLEHIGTDMSLEGIGPALANVLAACCSADPASSEAGDLIADFLEGLKRSTARGDALTKLEDALAASCLFADQWLADFTHSLRQGKIAADRVTNLSNHLDRLEGVLRVRAGRAAVPATFLPSIDQLLSQVISSDEAMSSLQQTVLTLEISRRLRENPTLQAIDAHRVEVAFERYRRLDGEKKNLVRDCISHLWGSKQKAKLLNSTGSRLNSSGADLRRRLTSRGERAMRLRQVIAIGDSLQGGDPLFDLRPVWMASPETVAQIFPRKAVFDVVIFDEASQCRLEEALPVLVRGRRVVIAGDPNQLPPTRFFESGLIQSEQEEPETDQELFETQQGEVEDLLAAALNLAIQQCYLDVHYRSRNADLIEFSNQNFYASRLQAIPRHPQNRSRFSPLTLYRVDGIYNKRQNQSEADRVVAIVYDLLKRAEPPSIGIACLNLPQRDLIVEKLDDLAGEDTDFARRLAAARTRKGQGSFEGLFVKNLENVQGDERDHIIISTTYGPDTQGKFYRRFGPLGMAGGGRRLNVLVTRVREQVHLVTSIPSEAYLSLPVVPEGKSATGAWLLFAYLKYAEALAGEYSKATAEFRSSGIEHQSETKEAAVATVNVLPSKSPSMFAEKLGDILAGELGIGSDVHWGNEGFCVDLALHHSALHHPARSGDVTIGVLCDGCRYAAAEDAVEWDIFRTGILASQGWVLRRIWSPHYFRDPQGSQTLIRQSVDEFVAKGKPDQALPTTPAPVEK